MIDISTIVKSINKETTIETELTLTSFESRLGDYPIPRSRPATGSSAIGSMKERPTRCNTPKILSFIIIISSKKLYLSRIIIMVPLMIIPQRIHYI